jgi:hypothetical protein
MNAKRSMKTLLWMATLQNLGSCLEESSASLLPKDFGGSSVNLQFYSL